MAGMGPLRARLPHITRVLGPAVSAADIVGYLGQLSSSMGGAAHVSNVQQLLALEDKCAEHVHTLTALPAGGASSSAGARVSAVSAAAGRRTAGGASSSSGSGKRTMASVLASTFSVNLANEVGRPVWRALEAALNNELTQLRPNSLVMVKALMNSHVLAARRFALGYSDEGVLELIQLSPVLAQVKRHIDEWSVMISRMLVVDRVTLRVPTGVTDLRLPEAVTACVKRGAFDEFNLVEGLLRPKLAAEQGVAQRELYEARTAEPPS